MNISSILKLIMSLFTYHTGRLEENSKIPSSEEKKVEEEQKIETHHIWEKGIAKPIGTYFNTREFTCKCSNKSCVTQKISINLVNRLDLVREELGAPIRVTSAFRCTEHQASLRGSGIKTATGTSTHELGEAVDIQTMRGSKDGLESVAEKHFTSIGIANTFLHLDTRKDFRRWKY